MTDSLNVIRDIVPGEIIQAGHFIPKPKDATPEQQAVLEEVRERLGRAGLYSFDVCPETGEVPLLPYDIEAQKNLGAVSYGEVMGFLSVEGLEVSRDYDAVWRSLRGTSARLVRDVEMWQAAKPFIDRQQELRQTLEQSRSEGRLSTEKLEELQDELQGLNRKRKQMVYHRKFKSWPDEPRFKPFMYIEADAGLEPLTREHNKPATDQFVPAVHTGIHLNNFYYNFSLYASGAMNSQIDKHSRNLLLDLVNIRVAERSQAIQTD